MISLVNIHHHSQLQFYFFCDENFFFLIKHTSFFLKIYLFLFLAVLGLRCCARAFSSWGEQGLLFVVLQGYSLLRYAGFSLRWLLLLRSTGSRRAGFSSCGAWAQQLWSAGSVVVAHRLSCSTACGIFPGQGSNPCPLHWQADS